MILRLFSLNCGNVLRCDHLIFVMVLWHGIMSWYYGMVLCHGIMAWYYSL